MKNSWLAGAAALAVMSCGGGSGGSSGGGGGGGSSNSPPTFSPPATVDFVEQAEEDILTLSASDPDGDNVTFTVAAGKDGEFFTIEGTALYFNQALSFETPRDANGDNVYEVDIVASDGTASVTRTIAVTITNSKEGIQTVRRIDICPGSQATSSSWISDVEFLVTCRNGRAMSYDMNSQTASLIVDVSVDRPGEALNAGYYYDAFFRRFFFTTQESGGTWRLHSYKVNFPATGREVSYEAQLLEENLTASTFLRTSMSDCFNNELCVLAGDTQSGTFTNALTVFTLDEIPGGDLSWSSQTQLSGLAWPGDLTRVERRFFITMRDNSQIGRYEFDSDSYTDEAQLYNFSNASALRPIEYYAGGTLFSLVDYIVTGDEFGQILTVPRGALQDGMLDEVGVENRTLDFEPDTGPFGAIASIENRLDRLFIIEVGNGTLYEVTSTL
ncbi:hypothetical protein [Sphingomicrobium marinum]|uniref:hypothetical protein n=1 Tax=Sphingomicrobium marinum TaxID=1227950 RepID=UPI0022400509|nr:hypothetical protein [Sphingomicrobium marinum]